MWIPIRRSRAMRGGRSQVAVAAAVLACLGLAACTAAEAPSPAPTAEAATIAPFPERGDIAAGTYLVTGYPVPFEITVPDSWVTFDGASLGKDDPDLPDEWNVHLFFLPATYVPTDACAWKGALAKIDPTAEAFVDAMTAQKSTVSSPPVKVMVGDYSGFEFDYAVESDVDSTDCDDYELCFYSNSAQDCDGRGHQNAGGTAGERETYRVVDLNGERAVIAVGQSHERVDPALTKEARAVFDSIKFVNPDAPDYVLALKSVGADEPPDPHGVVDLLGLRTDELRRYEDFRSVSVWSGETRDGTSCLLVALLDQGFREGLSADECYPDGSEVVADLEQRYSGPGGTYTNDEVFGDLKFGSLIRFVLRGDHVDVYVTDADATASQG